MIDIRRREQLVEAVQIANVHGRNVPSNQGHALLGSDWAMVSPIDMADSTANETRIEHIDQFGRPSHAHAARLDGLVKKMTPIHHKQVGRCVGFESDICFSFRRSLVATTIS
jgi:hypothetical protein